MTKSRFFAACMRQNLSWLQACAANPSPAWKSPVWLKLVRLAIRKKGGLLVALYARRSVITGELAKLSKGGWAGAKPVDYQPLELELEQIKARIAELEGK